MTPANQIHYIPNPWVIITGAAGGLGTSFAQTCAMKGYNLLLIDLPGKNLFNLCDFLERNYPVQATYLEMDIAEEGFEKRVMQLVYREGMKVNMLINNAGINQNGLFEDMDLHYLRKMIDLNEVACLILTRALLPLLKRNNPSYLINVSSLGSFYALPRKTCYAATKGFIRQFSQALRLEVKKYGINVSVLCPGPMTTNINNYLLHRQVNWFTRQMMQHPGAVAEKTLKDAFKGKEIIIPGRLNRMLRLFLFFVPEFLKKRMALKSMKQLEPLKEPPQKLTKPELTEAASLSG